ncbi:DUF3800 domain-containing protein [Bosea sp. BK604]|uniref:DUF3800 domain-containing protein n=1 Tax=Bosea sp. BK604 TaxID=2512180 RepID=UPI001045E168|nr:DUF3800 domain-containing protein [Bosea sp. BK604]TCR63045.1 hypothetical protein EV560_109139 [Bosea sp. BK604]
MIKKYYVDESGNSGNLTRSGKGFEFAQQQIFSLACLGVENADALEAEIARLKIAHHIQAPEFKSSLVRARINLLHRRRIGGLTLFHDEQVQFDDILRSAKQGAEELARMGSVPVMPSADYHFEEQATFVFAHPHASPGIQAADILAGFVMRFARDLLYGERAPTDQAQRAFHRLVALTDAADGRGVCALAV